MPLYSSDLGRDYQSRAEADFYDPTNLDDEVDYDDLDPETRRRVEAQLNRRDRELAKRGGLQRPPAFLESGLSHLEVCVAEGRR
jgi:DNA replication licensing factor MCM2